MRLLKTDTIELHEYFEDQIPPYAILSHRWEVGEVSLQKLQSGQGHMKMAGYKKIVMCCAQARKDGWEYVVSKAADRSFGLMFHAIVINSNASAVDRYMLH